MTQPKLETIVSKRCGQDAKLSGCTENWAIEQPTIVGRTDIVRTEWENIGEGHSGDYNPADLHDENFLRFSVLLNGECVDDACYCTLTPAKSSDEVQVSLLANIHRKAIRGLERGPSIKQAMNLMSWISPDSPKGMEIRK